MEVRQMKKTFSGTNTAIHELVSDRQITYDEFELLIKDFSFWLSHQGLRKGDKIAIYSKDCIEFQVIFWGCLRIGVVPVLINYLISQEEVDAIIEDCEPRFIFMSNGLKCSAWDKVIRIELLFATLHSEDFDVSIDTPEDADAFMLYTSGSTGKPKGVVHTRKTIEAIVPVYTQAFQHTETSRVLSLSKMGFAFGLANVLTTLCTGATVVLYEDSVSPTTLNSIINKSKATVLCTVPTLYSVIASRKIDLSGIRCISAGEPLQPALRERLGANIVDTWGSTETPCLSLQDGVPVLCDVKIVDDELWVAPSAMAIRYYNQYDNTKDKFYGRWYRTGDMYSESNGVYKYEGRMDDMFKVRGAWVSPTELEDIINSHDDVIESAVVGKKDSDGLLKAFAYVVVTNQTTENNIRSYVADKLNGSNHKKLSGIEFVDSIPKTATGKIQRYKFK